MTNCAVLYIARDHKTRINLLDELQCDAHIWEHVYCTVLNSDLKSLGVHTSAVSFFLTGLLRLLFHKKGMLIS